MVATLRPTLGPFPRGVLVAPERGVGREPEWIDSGGLIARRMVQLADEYADPGAMFVRHMVWRLHEDVGDGTVTAAVMFQELLEQGMRFIAAGNDPVLLSRHLNAAMESICTILAAQAMPIEGRRQVTGVAESICADTSIAMVLGEVFDIIGAEGCLDVRSGLRSGIEREYTEGMVCESTVLSPPLRPGSIPDQIELENAALVISDLEVTNPRDLLPAMELALSMEAQALVLVVDRLSEEALALLNINHRRGALPCFAVRVPGLRRDEQIAALEDIAILTGGAPLRREAGATLTAIAPGHLGRVRRAWANPTHFGLARGNSDPRTLRAHLRVLRRAFEDAASFPVRHALQQRIGRLSGGCAAIRVCGATSVETSTRVALVQRIVRVLRSALRRGVVPGGGAALLACRSAVHADDADDYKRAAYLMWQCALSAPARVIAANAGYDADAIIKALNALPAGFGCDARSGRLTDMRLARILDPIEVLIAAVRTAGSSAALALTIEAQIYRRSPSTSIAP
ncbi:TCP-1/cpn60 chaperonin family protein [Roseiflexus sp.]|uniref:TCP-1/cpn60 chaperonin family protein n=1 Tax=Roseiflexus sp. TaxID=2562120 RepID=UPI00398AEAD7